MVCLLICEETTIESLTGGHIDSWFLNENRRLGYTYLIVAWLAVYDTRRNATILSDHQSTWRPLNDRCRDFQDHINLDVSLHHIDFFIPTIALAGR